MKILWTVFLALVVLTVLPVSAQKTVVRVLFYTGQVTVRGKPVSIGQELARNEVVSVGSNGTLQLSINGKVLKYARQTTVRVADAIRSAGNGENTAVANTVRTLAAAGGVSGGDRPSQAGATRIASSRSQTSATGRATLDQARQLANDELSNRLGIPNALFKLESEIRSLYGEDDMLILEPRASGITIGPVMFRWLRSPTAGGYVVTVRDHVGNKVFETTTTDTSTSWNAPTLVAGVLYTWQLTDQRNPLHQVQATFWQLDSLSDANVKRSINEITKEMGSDNPALPLVVGGFLVDNGCASEAARYFVTGAERTPERYKDFMNLALDAYALDIGMSEHEMSMVSPAP